MKALLLTLLLGFAVHSPMAAGAADERQLIAILESGAGRAEKDAACAALKLHGTPACIPAVAKLLLEPELAHSALYVLESMSEAGPALCSALDTTKGSTRIAVMNSLGVRRESAAVPILARSLTGPDEAQAVTAARALGEIGSAAALETLLEAIGKEDSARQLSVRSGVIAAASEALRHGRPAVARSAFQRIYSLNGPGHLQAAAFRGILLASDDGAARELEEALLKNDSPNQAAALQALHDLRGTNITIALGRVLPKASSPVRVALVRALAQRGGPEVLNALLSAAMDAEAPVRVAALGALGTLGSEKAISVLVTAAGSTTGLEQAVARQALLDLRGDVAEALVRAATAGQQTEQVEVIRAMAARREAGTVPALLRLTSVGEASTRGAALRALGQLGTSAEVPGLVRTLQLAKTQETRDEAEAALSAICRRHSRDSGFDVPAIWNEVKTGSIAARSALLRVCAELRDPTARQTIREGLKDASPEVRQASFIALCDTRDPELLPDLFIIARDNSGESPGIRAIQAYVRLASDEEDTVATPAERMRLFAPVLELAKRPEDVRLIMAGMAAIPAPEALSALEPFLDRAPVRREAAQAMVQVATLIARMHPEQARNAFELVLKRASDDGSRAAAQKGLLQMDSGSGFLTAWEVSDVYRKEGADYSALLEMVFPPETEAVVKWSAAPNREAPGVPHSVDLLGDTGARQCVAYARTRIYSESAQECRLELGSDDGVKAWLNGKLVHAHNVARPLIAGQDKVDIHLQQGWNVLLLKVSQNNQGWGFTARCVSRHGTRLGNLKF